MKSIFYLLIPISSATMNNLTSSVSATTTTITAAAANKVSDWLHNNSHLTRVATTIPPTVGPSTRILRSAAARGTAAAESMPTIGPDEMHPPPVVLTAAKNNNDDADGDESSVDTIKYIKSNRTITRTKRKTMKHYRTLSSRIKSHPNAAAAALVNETVLQGKYVVIGGKRYRVAAPAAAPKVRVRYNSKRLNEMMSSSSDDDGGEGVASSTNGNKFSSRRLSKRQPKKAATTQTPKNV